MVGFSPTSSLNISPSLGPDSLVGINCRKVGDLVDEVPTLVTGCCKHRISG